MLFLFFKPRDEDKGTFDLEFPDKYYDATPRNAEEMAQHFMNAVQEVTKDWTVQDMEARLALMVVSGYDTDQLQYKFLQAACEWRKEQ